MQMDEVLWLFCNESLEICHPYAAADHGPMFYPTVSCLVVESRPQFSFKG